MQSILVKGGRPLHGEIYVSGAKNAALPIMTAALLTDQKLELSNIPKLTDVKTMKSLLANHGAKIEVIDENDCFRLSIDCSKIDNFTAPYDIVSKMRASIWVLGPLVTRFGQARVSLPGGCAIGNRQVDFHIKMLTAMGADVEIEHGYINAKCKGRLQGVHFIFDRISVGATVNAIMAATLAQGETLLINCAQEPEIIDLCRCLVTMGAMIEGAGSSEIRIMGVNALSTASHRILPDRIEAGTYMTAAAISKGELDIIGIEYHLVENLATKLIQAGLEVTSTDDRIKVRYAGILKQVNIQTEAYPGFSTDLQAQFMSLMTLAEGTSVITENIFENRFMHTLELVRMGADITCNGHSAIVKGVNYLSGAEVMASDLRASVSLILAGLAAEGETKVGRVYHLDRGYQQLESKLSKCGANIRRITE